MCTILQRLPWSPRYKVSFVQHHGVSDHGPHTLTFDQPVIVSPARSPTTITGDAFEMSMLTNGVSMFVDPSTCPSARKNTAWTLLPLFTSRFSTAVNRNQIRGVRLDLNGRGWFDDELGVGKICSLFVVRSFVACIGCEQKGIGKVILQWRD